MRPLRFLAAALLGACGMSGGSNNAAQGVTLQVSPETVAPGGSVTLTLRNDSTVAVAYNLCTSGLERRRDGGWETVPEDRVCTMELRSLGPGAQDRYTVRLPAALPAGEYRYQTSIELPVGGGHRVLQTGPFRVT
jgi:hypothetical protein